MGKKKAKETQADKGTHLANEFEFVVAENGKRCTMYRSDESSYECYASSDMTGGRLWLVHQIEERFANGMWKEYKEC